MTDKLRTTVISPAKGWGWPNLSELWAYRELLIVLTVRDIQVRYKQTAIGIGWVVIQPIVTTIVFSFLFGKLAGLPSDGLPYPVFVMCGLLPWQFFARALTLGSASLVSLQSVLTKVYFPRVFAPLSQVLSTTVDFAVAALVLLALMLWYAHPPTIHFFLLPFFCLLAILIAFGASLWLSIANVAFRDVQHALPFISQIWLFATPVAYSSSAVPEKWRWLLALNPMTGVVDGFRWTFAGGPPPSTLSVAIATAVAVASTIFGLRFFEYMQRNFADRV